MNEHEMNITRAVEEVNEGTLRKVARDMVKRVDKCIDMNGHHFQQLLYIKFSCVIYVVNLSK